MVSSANATCTAVLFHSPTKMTIMIKRRTTRGTTGVMKILLCVIVLVLVTEMTTTTTTRKATSFFLLEGTSAQQLTELGRREEYHKRNYTWPLTKDQYKPSTQGWYDLNENRFEQISKIDGLHDKYQAYFQTIKSSFLLSNYTEHGFGLARCPSELLHALQRGVRNGLASARTEQGFGYSHINGPMSTLFVDRPDLTTRALTELQHYAELWTTNQIELMPHVGYGFRLYRNESQLTMHVDRLPTHVISFILHVDRSDDAEPWPIYIEDYRGNTHEVYLEKGDILFYESTKVFHGRPKRFTGSWYTSVFVHYYPKYMEDGKLWGDATYWDLENHYAIPVTWSDDPSKSSRTMMRSTSPPPYYKMVGTTFTEPGCPNDWCRTDNTIRWSGPGEDGYVIDPNGDRRKFDPNEFLQSKIQRMNVEL